MTTTTWNGATGAWRRAGDWSNGLPNATTVANFTTAGTYTVTLYRSDAFTVGGVLFADAGATLALQGSLSVNGSFDLQAGTLNMSDHGVIHGGVLMMDGGSVFSQGGFASKGGTLDGVKLAGTLNLTSPVEQLRITNGLTGVAGGKGPAEIVLSGGEDGLTFVGNQTLSNATVFIENTFSYSGVYTTGVLTVAANAAIATGAAGPDAVLSGSKVINDGTIASGPSGAAGSFNIGLSRGFVNNGLVTDASNMSLTAPTVINAASGVVNVGGAVYLTIQGSFRNDGAVTIGSGGSVDVSSDTSIVNNGAISVGSGSLSLDQSTGTGVVTFTNNGSITIGQQGALSLLLNFTVKSLGNIVDMGRLNIDGTLDNSGQTLLLGKGPIFGGAGTTLGYGGLISGGTVVLGSSSLGYAGGGLANVMVQGALDLSTNKSSVNLDGGVTLTGANGTGQGLINLTGGDATLQFLDAPGVMTNAIDNVTINAGNNHFNVYIDLFALNGPGLSVTLGAHANIISKATGAQVMLQGLNGPGYTVVNAGLIDAGASGGTFMVSNTTLQNDGQITVETADAFSLGGPLTGSGKITLASGGSAELGQAAATQSVAFADANGTLKLTSAASFAATISGAVVGDVIDLEHTLATSAVVNASDQLVITRKGAAVATLQLQGDYSHTTFHIASDGAGGSKITLTTPAMALAFSQAVAGLGAGMGAAMAAGGSRAVSVGQLPLLAPHA